MGALLLHSFRRLALKYHPDKATHASHKAAADVIFKLVTAAYSVLSDPQKRSEHDRRRALGVGAFGGLGAAAAAAHAHAHRPFASGAAGGAAGSGHATGAGAGAGAGGRWYGGAHNHWRYGSGGAGAVP
jgi:molecular chaperone DnaJ